MSRILSYTKKWVSCKNRRSFTKASARVRAVDGHLCVLHRAQHSSDTWWANAPTMCTRFKKQQLFLQQGCMSINYQVLFLKWLLPYPSNSVMFALPVGTIERWKFKHTRKPSSRSSDRLPASWAFPPRYPQDRQRKRTATALTDCSGRESPPLSTPSGVPLVLLDHLGMRSTRSGNKEALK